MTHYPRDLHDCCRPDAPMSAGKVWCKASTVAVDGAFRGISLLGRMSPRANPERYGITVIRDVPYRPTGHPSHKLDIYVPRRIPEPRPTLLYVHGGGFRILSKDTHWLMGLAFARQGFTVFNADYRLAPRDSFPAAIEDACAAYTWVVSNARRYGGNPTRIVVAGESAGANLITSVAIAACYERPEPFARSVFDTGVVPCAALPACGLLQVSDPERFARRKRMPRGVMDRLYAVSLSYLPTTDGDPDAYALADPLVLLERGEAPSRPLPPFLAIVGTRDPILDDSRRLGEAMKRLGGTCEVRYYPDEVHAFHAFVWRPAARRAWRDTFGFIDRHVA